MLFRRSFKTAVSSAAVSLMAVGTTATPSASVSPPPATTGTDDGSATRNIPKDNDSREPLPTSGIRNSVFEPLKLQTLNGVTHASGLYTREDAKKSLSPLKRKNGIMLRKYDSKQTILLTNDDTEKRKNKHVRSSNKIHDPSVVDTMDGTLVDVFPDLDLGILDSGRIPPNGLETVSANIGREHRQQQLEDSEHYDPINGSRGLQFVSCANCPYESLLLDCGTCPSRPLVSQDANLHQLVKSCLNPSGDCPYDVSTPSCWNTSKVHDLTAVFYTIPDFNDPLNCWDVSSVTKTRSMFNGATAFNQPIENWNTASVTDMNGMFFGAASFNQPIEKWNTSSVSNMRRMFSEASSFNQQLGDCQTQSLEDMSIMFFGASEFNQPIDSWNLSSVIFYSGMFQGASSFNQCLSEWSTKMKNGVLNMQMFEGSGCPYNDETATSETAPWCQGTAQQCFPPCDHKNGIPCEITTMIVGSSAKISNGLNLLHVWTTIVLVSVLSFPKL